MMHRLSFKTLNLKNKKFNLPGSIELLSRKTVKEIKALGLSNLSKLLLSVVDPVSIQPINLKRSLRSTMRRILLQ